MRFRLAVAGALAAGLAAPTIAGAVNPQHAGLQVALRAQGLYDGPIDAIAVEPMTAPANAFRTGDHLVTLAPNGDYTTVVRYEVVQK